MIAELQELLDRLGDRPRALSRAASTELIEFAARSGRVVSVPVSGGRTVWDAVPENAVPVVETPNRLGIEEALPGMEEWVGLRRSPHVASEPRLVDTFDEGLPIGAARRLMHRLNSIRGIVPYRRHVVAMWFTVLAVDPSLLDAPGHRIGVEPLGNAFPDVPGGVRVDVCRETSAEDISRYAAAVEQATGGKTP